MPNLQVFYDPSAPPVVEGVLTFETGGSPEQIMDPSIWVYDHHGEGFGQAAPGALTMLFEDMVMGRPTPAAFLSNRIRDVDVLVAATLFLHRHLLTLPKTVGVVAQIDLLHRRGVPMLGHLEEPLGRFVRLLRGLFPAALSVGQVNERLPKAIGWIKDYLERDVFPSLGSSFPNPRVLDQGSNGFVVAETVGNLTEGWVELYRQGYYQGVLFGTRIETQLSVLVARKSLFVPLNLSHAALVLNEAEELKGGLSRWEVDGDWLWGPREGSLLLATEIVRTVASLGILLLASH